MAWSPQPDAALRSVSGAVDAPTHGVAVVRGALPDRLTAEWIAKLPASREAGVAAGFDGRAWISGFLMAFARDRAERTFLGLDDFMTTGRTIDDLDRHIVSGGMAMLEGWASTMARCGCAAEPWAAEAAQRAALAYRERIERLLATSDAGGRA